VTQNRNHARLLTFPILPDIFCITLLAKLLVLVVLVDQVLGELERIALLVC
jgi:hypothetical protein